MIDIDELERIAKNAPAGKWEIHTSNSWRRVFADQGREKVRVIEPTTQHDRWPDLVFGPGVKEWIEGVTPDTVLALIAEVRALHKIELAAAEYVQGLLAGDVVMAGEATRKLTDLVLSMVREFKERK